MDSERQKVLVVDDSKMILKILTDMLSDDYNVIKASSGEEALQTAPREMPDIILLDVMLDGMDGYQVCNILKKDSITRNIPIIFISGLSEENNEQKGLETGAIDYITKPFSEPIVRIRIKNHLELKRHRDILEKLSSLDGLSGIYNRRYFDEYYKQEWNRAIYERKPISLILIDIDRFKIYNDNYGHLAGDEVIKSVSAAMEKSILRKTDIAVRYGGEEFICVLPDADLEDALIIAKRIQENLKQMNIPHAYSDVSNIVTVSIGAGSIFPNEKYDSVKFINAIDMLLYDAKNSGRNRIKSNYIVLPVEEN